MNEIFADLNNLVGLENIKQVLKDLVDLIELKNKTKGKFILLSIASVAVLWLLQQIPYIGGYVSIFTVVFGLGIFVFSLFVKKETLEKVENK